MGFWHVYMGIEGGGGPIVITVGTPSDGWKFSYTETVWSFWNNETVFTF